MCKNSIFFTLYIFHFQRYFRKIEFFTRVIYINVFKRFGIS